MACASRHSRRDVPGIFSWKENIARSAKRIAEFLYAAITIAIIKAHALMLGIAAARARTMRASIALLMDIRPAISPWASA